MTARNTSRAAQPDQAPSTAPLCLTQVFWANSLLEITNGDAEKKEQTKPSLIVNLAQEIRTAVFSLYTWLQNNSFVLFF